MPEPSSIPKNLSIREQLKANPGYSTKLYIVTGTTVLASLFIILSHLYAFPGPKSSLLTFNFQNTTYKIYPFKYCISGSEDDEYSANGNGCHLSSNPLSYILSTNKLPTPPKDIQLFHTLTSLSLIIYYLSLHLNLLLLYHIWRRIIQPPILPLWTACLSQTLTLLLPSTLLTLLTQTLSSNPTYNPPPRTGTTYLFLLHTIWLIHFVALATLLALQYTRKRRRRLIAELDDFNTGVRVPRARSGSHQVSGSGDAPGASPAASPGYYNSGPGAKGGDEEKGQGWGVGSES